MRDLIPWFLCTLCPTGALVVALSLGIPSCERLDKIRLNGRTECVKAGGNPTECHAAFPA